MEPQKQSSHTVESISSIPCYTTFGFNTSLPQAIITNQWINERDEQDDSDCYASPFSTDHKDWDRMFHI